ncbi:hypothetical protein [Halorubrum sp. GN11_10-6_MGM]|uniref:hypothetical protein n=1 Tax=Halorubrum sp. GN11_10-6_MGM TaxID=2518112 RepID=UPI00130E843B|nr:hypothetical protein [Halorubrum sp. GN11_10-6_MGM]
MSVTAPIRSGQREDGSGRRPCRFRSPLGTKITVLLLFVVLFLWVFVAGLIRGLG